MSWFKRSKNPYATDDYLQTAETVSRPMAVLYTIIMVFVVGALAFSVFFGGRWLYEHLDGSNKSTTTVVENPITTTPVNGATSSAETSSGKPSSGSSSSSNNTTASSSSQSQSSNATSQGSTATTQATVAADSIPATGPTETLMVFIVSVMVGTVAYQLYVRKRI